MFGPGVSSISKAASAKESSVSVEGNDCDAVSN